MPKPVNDTPAATTSATSPPGAIVEVILLSEHNGTLRYRDVRAALTAGVHPDDLAKELSGLGWCTPGALLHSTSWRFEDNCLVLTYAALPDPRPQSSTRPLWCDAMIASPNPLMPSPAQIGLEAVAAHAGRHLAFLHANDDVVVEAAAALPAMWTLLIKLTPRPASALHAY
jgi:hypothetical protein